MLRNPLKIHLQELLGTTIKRYRPVSGGDISDAYLLETSDTRFFLKVNTGHQAAQMFEVEKAGLELIASSKVIATPQVFGVGQLGNTAFLILEFIESKRASEKDLQRFGEALAKMHQQSREDFGWWQDNFIGSLVQVNHPDTDWAHFYWYQRLKPQMTMALEAGLLPANEVPESEIGIQKLTSHFAGIVPSLLHGDLWSGNYLIRSDGTPYLIDPAVYYGHHEVDLAMSRLFGGFGETFYEAHAKIFAEESGWQNRVEIYQLYYLLVHLNLFGSSYYPAASKILRRYF